MFKDRTYKRHSVKKTSGNSPLFQFPDRHCMVVVTLVFWLYQRSTHQSRTPQHPLDLLQHQSMVLCLQKTENVIHGLSELEEREMVNDIMQIL